MLSRESSPHFSQSQLGSENTIQIFALILVLLAYCPIFMAMKETDFIHQNKDKWAHLEAQIRAKRKHRKYDQLGEQFVQLSEDLGYAQTYYPRRSVRLYLNGLAQRLYKNVFNARTRDKNARLRFWTHELPTALWESRLELILALAIFLLATFVGVVSSEYQDSFANQILGDRYINMTEANIEKGDPMGVYKDMDAVPMFFMIMYNNLQVSAIFFVLGILFGVGTVGLLFSNGVMLGVFQYFFFQRGLGLVSMLTIWQHGTIEIASAVVAGGAGLVLGRSMIFPGTLPRSVSLKFGFLKGLKILLGVAPLIVVAAFIESFFTRFDGLPMAIRVLSILASLVFIIGYYVILPLKRGRRLSLLRDVEENYSESHNEYTIELNKLKNNGENLSDALIIIQQHLDKFTRAGSIPAFVLSITTLLLLRDQFAGFFYFTPLTGFWADQVGIVLAEVWNRLAMLSTFFQWTNFWVISIIGMGVTFLIQQVPLLIAHYLPKHTFDSAFHRSRFAAMALIQIILLVPFFISFYYGFVYVVLVIPLSAVAWYIQATKQTSLGQAYVKAVGSQVKLFIRYAGMVILSALFSLLVLFLVQSPAILILFELGNNFIGFSEGNSSFFVDFTLLFVVFLTVFCGLSFFMITAILNYKSVEEINACEELLEQIDNISTRNF